MTRVLSSASLLLLICGIASGQKSARECSPEALKATIASSKIVITAKVKKVFGPPGYWSGVFAAMQLVEYEPTNVLKGELKGPSVVASHYVVFNSPTADPREDHPQLSPDLFRPGRELIVLLNAGAGKFWPEASACTARENQACAVLSRDEQHVELAKVAKSGPVPAFTVENENCGVLPVESKAKVIGLLK